MDRSRRLGLSRFFLSLSLVGVAAFALPPPACGAAGASFVPPGYRLVYNTNGDHLFHILPARPRLREYSVGGPSPFQSCTTTNSNTVVITYCSSTGYPLFSASDAGGTDTTGVYLATIEGALSTDNNSPLEIINQADTSGGAAQPAPISGGYGGIDILQSAKATYNSVTMVATNYSSPSLRMCAEEIVGMSDTTGPDCWIGQVVAATGDSTPANAPDTFEWSRQTNNSTGNITMLWPAAINLAAAPKTTTPESAGQITVGPAPVDASIANANVPSTFTGANTANTSSSAQAGPITIEPGQLNGSAVAAGATEGPLQILQSYLGTNASGGNLGFLACPSGTAQNVVPCGNLTPPTAKNWVGVYNNIPNQSGASVTPVRYGRMPVASNQAAQNVPWTNGDFVCKDLTTGNASYAIDNKIYLGSNVPCSAGESVGVAVGDPTGTSTPHLVDLIPAASVSGTTMMTFFCINTVTASATLYMFPSALTTACNSTSSTNATGIQPLSVKGQIRNLQVKYAVGPANGVSDTFTVLVCPMLTSCAASPVTCAVTGNMAGTATSCSDGTHSELVNVGDGIQITDGTGSGSGAANPRISIQIQ